MTNPCNEMTIKIIRLLWCCLFTSETRRHFLCGNTSYRQWPTKIAFASCNLQAQLPLLSADSAGIKSLSHFDL